MNGLSPHEKERYDRQILLEEIGEEGQMKLKNARVLIVGVGGLGSPVALYLAGAGIGHLGLVDYDMVSESNLQRQVLYSEAETGKPKALCCKAKTAGNPWSQPRTPAGRPCFQREWML